MSLRTLHNMGTLDRTGRAIVGAVVLSLAFVGPRTPWGFAGLILLVTAAIGFCPLYTAIGVSTCKGETTP